MIGDNRKMVVFPLGELPELARGQGVTLQRYRDGGLRDAIAFPLAEGLSWPLGGETRTGADRNRPVAVARGAGRSRADAADRVSPRQPLRLSVRSSGVIANLVNMCG